MLRDASAWTGNDARVVGYSEEELPRIGLEPLLRDAITEGIELHGSRRVLPSAF